jgi:carboxyl-terminal processing protease
MPKLKFHTTRKVLFIAFAIFGVFSFGYVLGFRGVGSQFSDEPNVIIDRNLPQDKKEVNFNLFWRVWDIVDSSYFRSDDIKESEMVYGAIKGMVASLGDPYTIFLPPKENKVVEEDLQGSFSGVGIQIGFKGTQLAVVAPLPESPAEQAGIEAGDLIVGIKDDAKGIERGTSGISLPEAVQVIRGPEGSTVTLSLLRESVEEPIVVDVVRREIDVPSIVLKFIEDDRGKIAHVNLLKFSGETTAEWEEAVINILKEPGVEGIVFDVRNNPGGYLTAAVDLASDFLETGDTVVIEESRDKARNESKVEKIGRLRNRKIVILINGGSASASEILAGALRDNLKSPLVGETSFGKGTIQEAQDVDGTAGLHITIARWLTPKGFWVNDGGLVPDVEVADNPDTEEDEQMTEAINQLFELI